MKCCSACRITKPLDDFHRSKVSGDGRTNRCKVCSKAAQKRFREKHADRLKAERKEKSAEHVERVRKWRKDNPEKFATHAVARRQSTMRWRAANRQAIAKYDAANRWAGRSRVARRRAQRKRATPTWADHEHMREIYRIAAELEAATGQRYHVDHIVPLQSDIVCGLHNHFNLQILTAFRNQSKSNRDWPDKP